MRLLSWLKAVCGSTDSFTDFDRSKCPKCGGTGIYNVEGKIKSEGDWMEQDWKICDCPYGKQVKEADNGS